MLCKSLNWDVSLPIRRGYGILGRRPQRNVASYDIMSGTDWHPDWWLLSDRHHLAEVSSAVSVATVFLIFHPALLGSGHSARLTPKEGELHSLPEGRLAKFGTVATPPIASHSFGTCHREQRGQVEGGVSTVRLCCWLGGPGMVPGQTCWDVTAGVGAGCLQGRGKPQGPGEGSCLCGSGAEMHSERHETSTSTENPMHFR